MVKPMLYYYPNRPKLVPPDPDNPLNPRPDYLNSLEKSGKYVGELKWNGDNTLIYTDDMAFWNRYKARLSWHPPEEVLDECRSLFPKKCVINVETVNSRTKTVKNLLIAHCIMVWKGQPLAGRSWGDSRHILEDLPWNGQEHVRLSETFKTNFWDRFQSADGSVIEGIILKNPEGKLVLSTTPIPDVSWMLKVRKPCRKYNW